MPGHSQIDTQNEIDALNASAYRQRNQDPEAARALAQLALESSQEIDYSLGVGCAYRTLASVSCLSSMPQMFEYAVKALDILLADQHHFEACSAYLPVTIYYAQTGQLTLAETTVKQCLGLAQETGNVGVESLAEYNLGYLLQISHQPAAAELHFSRAIQLSASGGCPRAAALAWAELASIASPSPDTLFSLTLFRMAMQSCSVEYLPEMLRGEAIYLWRTGEVREAKRAFRRARQLCRDRTYRHSLLKVLQSHARCLAEDGCYLRAVAIQSAVMGLTLEKGLASLRAECLQELAEYEFASRQFENAARHLLEFIPLKEKLHSKSAEARYRELEVLHRTASLSETAVAATKKAEELTQLNHQLNTALERQTVLQKELMRLASTDDLTGATNRRQVINDGILEMERFIHMGAPFSVTIIDIDHFKQINDAFGHATGDEILRRLSKCCQAMLRNFDVFGRLGGEEFCIIHHDTDVKGATKAVERLMKAVGQLFVADILPDRPLTVSIGIAQVHKDDVNFFDVLHNADMALYEAKRLGRNTFRTACTRFLEAA